MTLEAAPPMWVSETADRLRNLDDGSAKTWDSIAEAIRVLGMLEIDRCASPAIAMTSAGPSLTWKSWGCNYVSVIGFEADDPGRFLISILRSGEPASDRPWIECNIVGLRKALGDLYPSIRHRWLARGE